MRFTRQSLNPSIGGLVLALILAATAPTAKVARAQQVAGCSLFPTDSIWNVRIDSLPLDPASDVYIDTIGADDTVHPDFGSGEWPPDSGSPIGIPFDVVPASQTPVPLTFLYDDESDPGPYPIPPDAAIEGGAASNGDRHVLVVESGSCILYELFYSFPWRGEPPGLLIRGRSSISVPTLFDPIPGLRPMRGPAHPSRSGAL